MALVTLRQALDEAVKGGYALGGFNVNNLEQVQGIMEAARATKSPVILQTSMGARKYAGNAFLYALMKVASEEYAEIPVVIHQDHGDLKACMTAVDLGYTSVMIDASLEEDHKTPSSFEYNVEMTKKVVEYAHSKGVSVEAELGVIGGVEDGVGAGESVHRLTDPKQAEIFVEMTGIDALAVAVGTSHGAYKFSRKPDGEILVMDRIYEIQKLLPKTHLVMHGSSSLPEEYQVMVNTYGGELKHSFGVPIEEIQKGIKNGVRKVNVDTDIRLAITGSIRKFFIEHPEKFDPRDYLTVARQSVTELISKRMQDFGQAGHASDYIPKTLEEMKAIYF